ncbi:hypothetical protein K445DRAFT_152828 [Daldinia sp. EC12]|nr:hypothetical protein K445DRAFT_152828 [Daldinia sp. EC12]
MNTSLRGWLGCHSVLPSHHYVGNIIVFFFFFLLGHKFMKIHVRNESYRLSLSKSYEDVKETHNMVNAGSAVRLARFNIS